MNDGYMQFLFNEYLLNLHMELQEEAYQAFQKQKTKKKRTRKTSGVRTVESVLAKGGKTEDATWLTETLKEAEKLLQEMENEIDWDISFSFPNSIHISMQGYGEPMPYNELYELLCQSFNGGVSFVDTYFQVIFKPERNHIAALCKEVLKNTVDAIEKATGQEFFGKMQELFSSMNEVYNPNPDWLWMNKNKKKKEEIEREAEKEFNFSDDKLYRKDQKREEIRRKNMFVKAIMQNKSKEYIEKDALAQIKLIEAIKQSGGDVSRYKEIVSAKKKLLEKEARRLSKMIKDDIMRCLRNGTIPLNHTISNATIKKRKQLGIKGRQLFYATGNLIRHINIVLRVKNG